jgi:hypothetical protein
VEDWSVFAEAEEEGEESKNEEGGEGALPEDGGDG